MKLIKICSKWSSEAVFLAQPASLCNGLNIAENEA